MAVVCMYLLCCYSHAAECGGSKVFTLCLVLFAVGNDRTMEGVTFGEGCYLWLNLIKFLSLSHSSLCYSCFLPGECVSSTILSCYSLNIRRRHCQQPGNLLVHFAFDLSADFSALSIRVC